MSLRFRQRKFYNISDLEQMIENSPESYKRHFVGKTLFMVTALALTGACVLATLDWMRQDISVAAARPLETLVEEMGSVREYTIENERVTIDGDRKRVTTIDVKLTEVTVTNFIHAMESIITYAARQEIDILNLNADGIHYGFNYRGLEMTDGNPVYDVDLQQTLTILRQFEAKPDSFQTNVSSVLPEDEEKRNVSIFVRSLDGKLNDLINSQLDYFQNDYQFENKTYTVTAAIGGSNYMAVEAPVTSLDDLEAPRNVRGDTYTTLREIVEKDWVSELKHVTYQVAAEEKNSRMFVVFGGEQKVEQLRQEARDYFLGLPQVLRPAPYYAIVTYDTRDAVQVYGIWR